MPQPKKRRPVVTLTMSIESGDVEVDFNEDENAPTILELFYMLEVARAKLLGTAMTNIQMAREQEIRRTSSNILIPN